MSNLVPPEQIQFAQIAASQHFVTAINVRAGIELYKRYQAAGGEVPSMARILVGKGWLSPSQGQIVLRHMLEGGSLPVQNNPAPPVAIEAPVQIATNDPQGLGIGSSGEMPQIASSDFEAMDDLGLEPPGSNIDLPVSSGVQQNAPDERQALIEGLGATVLRKELKDIKGYKITQVIGEGSMGIVYKAHQISMDRTVALKVLPAEKTKDQRFVEEFLTEARNTGRLNHPNLIRVHEVGKSGDTYYYSMEYVDGQRLDEWMDECEGGRLEPREAVKVFIQIAAALDYGFRAKVIHREIRPNSVLVGDDGQAKLSELGLTKDEHTRFLDGENAYYVAPEQAKGMTATTQADIYSLGCCLFHCLTGEPPFQGGSPKEVLSRRLVAVTPDPRELNPDVPVDLANVVTKMMARDLKERFQTPAEVAEALKKIQFGLSTITKKPMQTGTLKKTFRQGRPVHGRPGVNGRRPGRTNRNRYRR
jgi:predicted Ser/Thr protein kinase